MKRGQTEVDTLMIHCTATREDTTIDELVEMFKQRGWKNPGYHVVVGRSGFMHELLPVTEIANGARGWNKRSIHVAWMGGVDENLNPVDNRTERQKRALQMYAGMMAIFHNMNVIGHRDIWGSDPKDWEKACPCFDVKKEWNF